MRSNPFQKVQLDEDDLPWWQHSFVVGYDEGSDSEGGDGDGGGEDEEGEEGDAEPDESTPDGLKKALEKERALRKEADKRLRITTKKLANAAAGQTGKTGSGEGDGGKTPEGDGDGAKSASTAATKVEKLIETIRNNELRNVVSKLASTFQDPEDVFAHLDTNNFDYEQDDDDPSNVVFDEAEIRTAIKDLAKRKPYLLKPAAGETGGAGKPRQSGPKFAGRGPGKQTGGLSSAEIASRFPAMRTAVRAGKPKSE